MNNTTPDQGVALLDWQAPCVPPHETMAGEYCCLQPLATEHSAALFEAYSNNHSDEHWAYLPYGPFKLLSEFESWVESCVEKNDTQFYCVCIKQADGNVVPAGIASYLRINPDSGSIEVGHIHYSSMLQNTAAATDAMYLMMSNAFTLGYRRYEWKCNALNEASRLAASRLGFTYEGIFRQAAVVKGCNRDTAWFSVIDGEWPALARAYMRWLEQSNFDQHGMQRESLGDCIKIAAG